MHADNKPHAKKHRIDELLVERGICGDLNDASRLVMAGQVRIGADRLVAKPSEKFPSDADIRADAASQYVSRGAYKLLPALDRNLPRLDGLAALDAGASTGGFTDLMLQRGAGKVYAMDVGRGQLHSKLRNDPRVVCMERVNARTIPPDFLPEKVDVLTMDLSFISVKATLPAVGALLKKGGWAFVLVKPQFEAGRENVGKGGVVRDENVIRECVEGVARFGGEKMGWEFVESVPSPIKGPKGNQEHIVVFRA